MPESKASVSVIIGAKLGSAFKNSFTSADKQLKKLGSAIKEVETKSGQIDAYKKQAGALDSASIAYKNAQQKLNILKKEMDQTGPATKELTQNIKRAEREVDKTKRAFLSAGESSRQMGQALRQAGVNTHALIKETSALDKALKVLKSRQTQLQNIENAKSANLSKRSSYRSQMFDAVALGGALYGTIKPAVDFEYAMAKVGAITNESAKSEGFKQLSEKARELGRTTQYTSAQAAEAMQYLGMAGFNTQQILKATPAALNLAIAGNMDLGRTADIASNILTGFNLKAEETTRVADVLAQTSRTTNVNVEMLGETMKYAAPAAAAVGGTLEETAALAGVLGDAGIQATMSGTMLRAAYLRLAAPVGKGAKALEKMKNELHLTAAEMPEVAKNAAYTQAHLKQMGVTIFDKKGNMRSMVDIFKDLGAAMKGANDQEKLSTVKAIFGDRASAGALAIFNHIETGRLDEVLAKVKNSQGAAQEMADRMKDTTVGAFLEMKSATESVAISFGSVLLPPLAKTMRFAAGWANKISTLAEQHPTLSKAIGFTVIGLIGFKIALIGLGFAFTFVKAPLLFLAGGYVKLRTALTLARIELLKNRAAMSINGLAEFGKSLWTIVRNPLPALKTALMALGRVIKTHPLFFAISVIAMAAPFIIKYWQPIKEFFVGIWDSICAGATSAWQKIKKVIEPLIKLKNLVGSAWNSLFGNSGEMKETAKAPLKPENHIVDVSRNVDVLNNKAKSAIANDNSSKSNVTNNITINPSKGMDEIEVAKEVQRAIEEKERQMQKQKRAGNYD